MLLLFVIACGPKVDLCKEAAKHEATIELGSGERSFLPLDDGDAVTLQWGNQGGNHVWASVVLTGVNPGREAFGEDEKGPDIRFTLTDEDDVIVGQGASRGFPIEGSPKRSALIGETLFLDFWDGGANNATYTMAVDVMDTCGTSLSDSRTVTIAN